LAQERRQDRRGPQSPQSLSARPDGPFDRAQFTPELRFVEDTSFAEAERIENILKSERVQRDLAKKSDGDEP